MIGGCRMANGTRFFSVSTFTVDKIISQTQERSPEGALPVRNMGIIGIEVGGVKPGLYPKEIHCAG
jgi:hypothetical protein